MENKSLAVQFTSLLQLIENGEYKTMRGRKFFGNTVYKGL